MIPRHPMQTIKNSVTKFLLFLTALTLFVACRPPAVRALLEGQQLLQEGKYSQAAEKLRMAANLLNNTNAVALNYLGVACHQAGQLAEAERTYHRVLALNPDLTEAHYNLG